MAKKIFIFSFSLLLLFLTQTNSFALSGFTPGFFKQTQHLDSWNNYSPSQSYNGVFGLASSFDGNKKIQNLTLMDALKLKGGGEEALARHAVAALLNSVSNEITYFYSEDDVKKMVLESYNNNYFTKTNQPATASNYDDFETIKNYFEAENELGAPEED